MEFGAEYQRVGPAIRLLFPIIHLEEITFDHFYIFLFLSFKLKLSSKREREEEL